MKNIFEKQVRHQARVPTIAIWKSMNRNESVVETNRNLVRGFFPQLYPKLSILAKISDAHGNLMPRTANVLVALSIMPRPFPHGRKHAPMESLYESLI